MKMQWLSALVLGALSCAAFAEEAPADSNLIKQGEYLARAGDCVACHTNGKAGKPFAGGLPMETPIGTIYSTNITPDKEHGIGGYTFEEFDDAVRKGVRKDGSTLYVWIQGDEVRVHQVLVNVLSNALDACPHAAQITVSWQIQGGRLCVLIADNGPGWPAALLPSLLKPFTTSKTVGLGIGLSICVSLMTQMEGALRLASTFTRSACVVLEFNLTDVKDVE